MKKLQIPEKVGETTIIGKNEMSVAAEVVRKLAWVRGDRLVVETWDEDALLLRRLPRTAQEWVRKYSGKLGDVFGDHEDTMRFLDELQPGWEREPADGNS